MKKLLLSSIVAAFACVSVQAGDNAKTCDAAKTCADKAKTACAAQAKAKAATCETACCAKKLTKKADSTAKGATRLLAKR